MFITLQIPTVEICNFSLFNYNKYSHLHLQTFLKGNQNIFGVIILQDSNSILIDLFPKQYFLLLLHSSFPGLCTPTAHTQFISVSPAPSTLPRRALALKRLPNGSSFYFFINQKHRSGFRVQEILGKSLNLSAPR